MYDFKNCRIAAAVSTRYAVAIKMNGGFAKKSKLCLFLSGVLVTLILIALPVSALASDGSFNLTAYPIQVLVNGEVFRPVDAKGNEVQVFTVNGTTYAPLRALAEAYGLEVGYYDSTRNIATVTKPSAPSAPASDFAPSWEIKEKPVTNYGSEKIFTITYSGSLSMSEFKTWWKSFSAEELQWSAEQLAAEAQALNPGYQVTIYFSYGSYNLGTAFAYGDYEFSNFNVAGVWIK